MIIHYPTEETLSKARPPGFHLIPERKALAQAVVTMAQGPGRSPPKVYFTLEPWDSVVVRVLGFKDVGHCGGGGGGVML